MLGQAILTWWRLKTSGLWRVPHKPTLEKKNYDTILLNKPDPGKPINNVYEIPIMEEVVWYLHTCSVSTTKETWHKSIGFSHYTTWSGLTIKATNKYDPKLEENMKGHMQETRQGVIPTKK